MHQTFPLSHAQKRIWHIESMYPNSAAHNIGGIIIFNFKVDYKYFSMAINKFIELNPAMRTRIIKSRESVVQSFVEFTTYDIPYYDYSSYSDPLIEIKNRMNINAKIPFTLYESQLYAFEFYKLNDDKYAYFLKLHHIIADGWSVKLLTEKINSYYFENKTGCDSKDENLESYVIAIENECKYLNSKRVIRDRDYWHKKFIGYMVDNAISSAIKLDADRNSYIIGCDKSKDIRGFLAKHSISMNAFIAAAVSVYLFRTTRINELVFGMPVLNRYGRKEKKIFGMLASTVAVRVQKQEAQSLLSFLKEIESEFKRCLLHQKYPYDVLVSELGELSGHRINDLYNVSINYNPAKPSITLGDLPVENIEFFSGHQHFSLHIMVKDWTIDGSLLLDIDYKTGDYSSGEIQHLFQTLEIIMDQLLNENHMTISTLNLICPKDLNYLLGEYNSTKRIQEDTIIELFERQVDASPTSIAVRNADHTLTYKQINSKINQLARALQELNCSKNSIIGILSANRLEALISIMAVLKLGAAYVPIDPTYPRERINYILDDSRATVLINDKYFSHENEFYGITITLNEVGDNYSDENLYIKSSPDDLAYLIYTSGSTGQPKGVMVEHKGLTNYICWARDTYIKSSDDSFALYSSIAFDLTMTSIFTPLICGASINIYAENDSEFILRKVLSDNQSTVIKLTPAHLSLLSHDDTDLSGSVVKSLIVGGEDLKTHVAKEVLQRFGGKIQIFNEYGPTETVVGCMIHVYNEHEDNRISVPIGRPIANTQIYLLDEAMTVVPIGTPGEIYVSGEGVARGYMNKEEQTKERFIENPFLPGNKMYKTGDIGRFLDNGIMEYMGRSDYQVKIRGYRIELEEIEDALIKYPGVKEAIVKDWTTGKDTYLCAYIVVNKPVDKFDIKSYLAELLPHYMIPTHFTIMVEFLLTVNGKVDRKSLPMPEIETLETKPTEITQEVTMLSNIYKEVLGEKINISDDFYLMGGDSIKAIQIASRLFDYGFTIKPKDIMLFTTIKELATHMVKQTVQFIAADSCFGPIKHTPITRWFFSQKHYNPNHWNQSILLKFDSRMSGQVIGEVLTELLKHHDSLRMNYNEANDELYYNSNLLDICLHTREYDLKDKTPEEQDNLIQVYGAVIKSSLDISNGPLIGSCLFQVKTNESLLLITIHHLAIDGVSWRIILKDIRKLLFQYENNGVMELGPKTSSYQQWADSLVTFSENLLSETSYWNDITLMNFMFPTDDNLEKSNHSKITEVSHQLKTNNLKKLKVTLGTDISEVLIGCLASVLSKEFSAQKFVIELEGHGREEIHDLINVSNTVGWFTAMYPLEVNVPFDDLEMQIQYIKEQLRNVPNKGIGYGTNKFLKGKNIPSLTNKIRFNYLGEISTKAYSPYFAVDFRNTGPDIDPRNGLDSIMEIDVIIIEDQLKITIKYCSLDYKYERIRKLLECYVEKLTFISNYSEIVSEIVLDSDIFDSMIVSEEDLKNLFE